MPLDISNFAKQQEDLPAAAVTEALPLADLEITRMVNVVPGTGSTGYTPRIMARDPNNLLTLWAGDSANHILKSTDDGTTWTLQATVAGVATFDEMFVTSAGTILAFGRSGAIWASAYTIYRSTDGATFNAIGATPFTNGSPYTGLLGQMGICQDASNNIYLAEYGNNINVVGNENDMHLFKSVDDGQTFTTVATFSKNNASGSSFSAVRHIHGVQVDPYVAGRIWICTGDSGTDEARIGYSDNQGTTFTWITRAVTGDTASYNRSRAVALMFTPTNVFWGADTPDPGSIAQVYSYTRGGGSITAVAGPWPNTFRGAATLSLADGTPILLALSNVELAQTSRDDIVRIIASADGGANWQVVFKWKREQADQSNEGGCWRYTTVPDASGAIWVCYEYLDGSAAHNNSINLKLQPRKRYAEDLPPRDPHIAYEVAAADQIVELSLPSTAGTGLAAGDEWPVFVAPTDLDIVSVSFMSKNAVAASTVNFWTAAVRTYRAGSQNATVAQGGGSNQAVAAFTAWPSLSFGGNFKVKAGDIVTIQAALTGVPVNLQNLNASLRLRRASQTLY